MFDLLLDPTTLGLLGSIGGGIAIKSYERRKTTKKVTRELRGEFTLKHEQNKEIASDSIYHCKVYSIRLFEDKLVEAGILAKEDMTVCEKGDCSYCVTTRRAISIKNKMEYRRAVQADIEKTKAEQSREHEQMRERALIRAGIKSPKYNSDHLRPSDFYCVTCNKTGPMHTHTKTNCVACGIEMMDPTDSRCSVCRLQARQKSRRQMVTVGDLNVPRPSNVPRFARPTLQYKAGTVSSVLWEWKYPDSRHNNWWRQPINTETVEISSNHGVIKRIECVYDPDTGEHLGDFEVTGLEEVQLYNECQNKLALPAPGGVRPSRIKTETVRR